MDKSPFKQTRLFILVVLLISTAFLCLSAWSFDKQALNLKQLRSHLNVEELIVQNNTKAFTIIAKEKTEFGDIRLTLKNDYDKMITAFEISIGSKSNLVDYALSEIESGIPPGGIYEDIITIDNDRQIDIGITILAIMLEDGTSDGSVGSIRRIQDYRAGERIEVNRFLSSLEKTLKLPDEKIMKELSNTISYVLPSSGTEDRTIPLYSKFGISDTRRRLEKYIERLQNDHNHDVKRGLRILINDLRRAERNTY